MDPRWNTVGDIDTRAIKIRDGIHSRTGCGTRLLVLVPMEHAADLIVEVGEDLSRWRS